MSIFCYHDIVVLLWFYFGFHFDVYFSSKVSKRCWKANTISFSRKSDRHKIGRGFDDSTTRAWMLLVQSRSVLNTFLAQPTFRKGMLYLQSKCPPNPQPLVHPPPHQKKRGGGISRVCDFHESSSGQELRHQLISTRWRNHDSVKAFLDIKIDLVFSVDFYLSSNYINKIEMQDYNHKLRLDYYYCYYDNDA